MAKYIDRNQLIDWLKTEIKFKDLSDGLGVCMVIMKEDFERAIKHMPDSIIKDVAPVRHGRWVDKPNPQWKAYDIRYCSVCGWSIHKTKLRNSDLSWRFCPNCGAKMTKGG